MSYNNVEHLLKLLALSFTLYYVRNFFRLKCFHIDELYECNVFMYSINDISFNLIFLSICDYLTIDIDTIDGTNDILPSSDTKQRI